MKTKIVLFFAVAVTAALLSQRIFANITYEYTGNPFTLVSGPYTTSDRVTGTVTLSTPLGDNMPLTAVSPLAFSFFDGIQTISNMNASFSGFEFATGSSGLPSQWSVDVQTAGGNDEIQTINVPLNAVDIADMGASIGQAAGSPGTWSVSTAPVPDPGSSITLLSLSLTALGVAARRFTSGQRPNRAWAGRSRLALP